MMTFGFASVLLAGLLMGMLHAFDPDHVLTISSLGSLPDARNATRRYALSWGVGHGGVLVIVALALLHFDAHLPDMLPQGAERLVGVIMIAAGGSLALSLWRNIGAQRAGSSLRTRAPFVIGMVHGTAGSATIFALLPIGLLSPVQGLVYVLIFSLGVLVGMMGFGHGFDRLGSMLAQRGQAFDKPLRGSIAALAMGVGVYWLLGA